jgi:hypothetical protein
MSRHKMLRLTLVAVGLMPLPVGNAASGTPG